MWVIGLKAKLWFGYATFGVGSGGSQLRFCGLVFMSLLTVILLQVKMTACFYVSVSCLTCVSDTIRILRRVAKKINGSGVCTQASYAKCTELRRTTG